MKIGSLVKLTESIWGNPALVGLVVDVVEKKCWRTHERGKRVDWGRVEPEPHAVVVIKGDRRTIPVTDLEVINESRRVD